VLTRSLSPHQIALQELRVFGVFETVSQKIAGLSDSIEGLLEQVSLRNLPVFFSQPLT
jgi:hypothetical protein